MTLIHGEKQKRASCRCLRSWQTNALALVAALGLIGWLADTEHPPIALAFTLAVTGALFGVTTIISRRPLFSVATTITLIAVIYVVARLKRAADGMVFHAWDLVQTLLSWKDLTAAFQGRQAQWLLGGLAAFVALGLLATLVRYERATLRRVYAATLLIACSAIVAWTGSRLPERGHTQYFWDGLYVSAFFRSFGETSEAIWRGGLFEKGAASGPVLAPAGVCRLQQKAPHILLIHEESVTPPSVFPGLQYDHSLDPFFTSSDGSLHHLRVETYGGASWLTQFSVLAGVSSRAFGRMSSFVQPFMSGRLADTVPQVLANCGYRNMMFTAWPKQFMGVARFYESIGIQEIFDQKAQGNVNENERDRFFFGNALREIERHVAVSGGPLFLFIETMSAHWPYDVKYEPNVDVPGGAPGADHEVHEYLRRLAMVKMDDDWLRLELARRFPGEAFLIVRYGDHHPLATRTLIGLPQEIEVESSHLPDESPGFITFFATNAVGYAPPPPPAIDTIDATYLGAILLDAARLPLPSSWRERLEMMNDCGGRYWSCADHERILGFQRRLLEAGLMRAH